MIWSKTERKPDKWASKCSPTINSNVELVGTNRCKVFLIEMIDQLMIDHQWSLRRCSFSTFSLLLVLARVLLGRLLDKCATWYYQICGVFKFYLSRTVVKFLWLEALLTVAWRRFTICPCRPRHHNNICSQTPSSRSQLCTIRFSSSSLIGVFFMWDFFENQLLLV